MNERVWKNINKWYEVNIKELDLAIEKEENKDVPDEDDVSFMEGQRYALTYFKRYLNDTLKIWDEIHD